ncbi:hypothetical protein Acr_10g0004500 [Actinidia rufa]|uniref:Uncharacterized protein n=1 Tax=Actinidia rufa TaxID=165716 RepID=A0A7J0F8Q4_9ERIC|nr:hypothetical protein Acr_10g0004500 [Actinidia rufa]
MEDLNEEGRLLNLVPPNFAPQNPNAMLNPPMGGVLQNPPPNPAHGLEGDNMEGGSIHGDMGAPQFRTLRDFMNPPRHVHSTEISNQPSSGHGQVQAIIVLRSGKTIDKTILPIDPKGRGEASKVVKGMVGEDRETGEKKESEVVLREEENKNEKGNDERKEKSGSVPMSEEVLREESCSCPIPPSICTVKRRLNVRENAFLAKDVHSVVQVKTPPKYTDSRCPTVTCVIGDHRIEGCLLDLGSSVNLLPTLCMRNWD